MGSLSSSIVAIWGTVLTPFFLPRKTIQKTKPKTTKSINTATAIPIFVLNGTGSGVTGPAGVTGTTGAGVTGITGAT